MLKQKILFETCYTACYMIIVEISNIKKIIKTTYELKMLILLWCKRCD